MTETKTVGVAMSGGGYRASAWGLGALLALTDGRRPEAASADTRPEVRMTASVSGGSITNAEFGLGVDLANDPPEDIDQRAATFAPLLAGSPRWFTATLVTMIAVMIIGPLTLRPLLEQDASRWVVVTATVMLIGALAGPRSGDLLFGWWAMWVYVGMGIAGIAGVIWIFFLPIGTAERLGWALIALVGVGTLLLVRSLVVEAAIARHLGSLGAGGSRLGDLGTAADGKPSVTHVICATELSRARFLYLGSGFACNYDLGVSNVPTLPVATAVQASSNLPGAFPVRWLSNRRLGLAGGAREKTPRFIPVTDGGVYENMGSQWFTGLDDRIEWFDDQGGVHQQVASTWTSPDLVCVANASGLGGPKRLGRAALPVLGELLGLLRVKTVLYEQTTASRRSDLIDRFDRHEPNGTLVHIKTNPFTLIDRRSDEPRATRAKLALEDLHMDELADQVAANARVATALWPLGVGPIAQVMHQAYIQTSVHMFLLHGTALRVPPIDEFVTLASGGTRDLALHWATDSPAT